MNATEDAAAAVESRRDELAALADDIWERPEPALEETYAAGRIAGVLRERGFDVTVGAGGLETAVVARYGDEEPVVGTMGEYDALPGMSQRRAAEREPVEAGAPGHGCGHNLFGVGSLGGALAVADLIDDGLAGSVVYVGTPAEEKGGGKTYLVRAGVFDDLDAVVSWHPGWYNAPTKGACLAVNGYEVSFEGVSSHAAAAPEAGRSALDGLQLFHTGVEYMREHVPDPVRIHYVVTEGGDAPNVVPPEATGEILVRAPDRDLVESVSERVLDAAEGAALMADVDVDVTQTTGLHGVQPNETLGDAVRETMADLGSFEVGDAETAAGLRDSLGDVESALAELPESAREKAREADYFTDPVDAADAGETGSYSTDSGEVSQVVPLGRFSAATWPVGTPAHSWQAVAASGTTGIDGAVYASKVIGATLGRLIADADLRAAATAEFESRREGPYEPPIPEDADLYDLLDVERRPVEGV
ncbi:amidohydrolase [Haloparvum sedimenti]|uniref:amidohydrolase n=1 Tax=Haloparvum sedimenti TaxID=1678448 RepID=UPI00071E996D|nr:amidohydrolase [Haloparvum sedimenti]